MSLSDTADKGPFAYPNRAVRTRRRSSLVRPYFHRWLLAIDADRACGDECVGKRPRPHQTRAPKPFFEPLPLHAERLPALAPGDEAPTEVLERGER